MASKQSEMQALLQPFFDVFREPDVAIGIAISIVGIAVVIFGWFTFRHMLPAILALRRVRSKLSSIPDHDAFNRDFNAIDEAISSEPLVKHGWEEFKETLLFPDDHSTTMRNTMRPSVYLNIGSIASKLELPFYQAMPNYFVGVGLFFTFCGLVAAIRFASEGVGGDIENAKSALGDLLTAATFKFATSIAGLGSSIALSIWFKILTLRAQRYFDRICELLEARLHFVTPEWLSVQQVSELKKQTLQLERFNTDFAVEVAQALEGRMTPAIGGAIVSAMQPMASALEGLAKGLSSVSQDALGQMVAEFKTTMQSATGHEMNAIVKALSEVRTTLGATMSEIGGIGGNLGVRIEAAANHLQRTLAESAERAGGSFVSHLNTASERLDKAVAPFAGQLDNLERTLTTLDARLKEQLGGFDGSITQFRNVLSELRGTFDQLRAAGAPIADTADKLGMAANQVEASANAMKQLQATLAETAKSVFDGSQRVSQAWESYRQRFEKVDEDLSSAFGRIQQGTDAYHQKLREFVVQVDEHFTSAVNLLGGGIEQLQDTVGELSEAADKLAKARP